MVRIEVPDEHNRGHIAIAGTPPNESETRLGAPRVEDIRVSDRYPRDVQIRRDDDGQRYVGVKAEYAEKVRQFFADEYGVAYDDDGLITGDTTDEPDPNEPDTTPDGESEPNDDADATDRPAPPDDTGEAHWNAVVTAIKSGAYDDSLGAIEDNDDRQSVQNAVGERREVLN